jgi:hypothetical protein
MNTHSHKLQPFYSSFQRRGVRGEVCSISIVIRVKLLFMLCFGSSFVFAQSSSFVAQVSKNKVAVGEIFQIAFTVNGAGGNISLPNINADFNIAGGPNQSNSMSMVNGNISQSTTISIFIAAKKEGKFTIGTATCVSGNQKLETKPIVIEVGKGASQQSSSSNQGNASQQQTQQQAQVATPVGSEELFVRTYLSKSKCYLGEQLILTQKVYSRVDLRGFQNVQFPQYNGFWSQIEENTKQIELKQENVNGVNYYVADYNRVFLFPQRTGNITVEPIELECIVRRQTKRQPRNIFEQFFGAGGYEDVVVKVKSKAVKVDVLDLPLENKPQEFSGAVGDYSYKAEISKQQVKANDAVNLKITISGKGNIKLVEPMHLNLPESFESYDPKVSEKISTNGGVSGSKTYDYLIIPREKGDFVLDKLNFSYFDSDKKQYVTLPTPEIKLTVLEGDAGSAQVITPTKKGIDETDNDIRYIKTGNLDLHKNDEEFFSSYTHYLLLLIPTIVFIGAIVLVRKHIKENSNLTLVKERKAAKMAKKQLVIAEKHLDTNNKELFFNEILNALHKYIGNKFNLSIVDLSKEKISEMLLSRHVTNDTAKNVIETLNTCEYAKYAPSAVTGDLQKVYNDTVELISEIEEQIKKI